MNYAEAMHHLTKYRKDKRDIEYSFTQAYHYIEKLKRKRASADGFNRNNIVEQSKFILDQYSDNTAPRLSDDVKSGCTLLNIEYTEKMRGETSAYETRMLDIQRKAADEIKKGAYKPLTDNALKLMGVIMLSIFALAVTFAGLALSMPSIILIGLGCGLIAILMATKKTKPDEAVLSSLVSEAQKITRNYFF